MFRQQYSMLPLTWLQQRTRVMRPTAYENSSLGEVSREAGSPKTVSVRQTFVTNSSMLLESLGVTTICREYTSTRDAKGCPPIGIIDDHTVIGPALDVQETLPYER